MRQERCFLVITEGIGWVGEKERSLKDRESEMAIADDRIEEAPEGEQKDRRRKQLCLSPTQQLGQHNCPLPIVLLSRCKDRRRLRDRGSELLRGKLRLRG